MVDKTVLKDVALIANKPTAPGGFKSLDMNNQVLPNVKDGVVAKDAVNKSQLDEKLDKTSINNTLTSTSAVEALSAGQGNNIKNLILKAAHDYVCFEAGNLYIDVRKPKQNENLVWNATTRAVSSIIDVSYGLNNSTSVTDITLSDTDEMVANRRYLEFDEGKAVFPNSINESSNAITIIFRPTSFATAGGSQLELENGLFGQDNGGWDRFVGFRNNTDAKKILMVGGATVDSKRGFAGFGDEDSNYDHGYRAGGFLTNADPSVINRIHIITVVYNGTGENASSVWCNGKKLGNFTGSSPGGATSNALGDINPTSDIAKFTGDMFNVSCFSAGATPYLTDQNIQLLHEYYQKDYAITTWG